MSSVIIAKPLFWFEEARHRSKAVIFIYFVYDPKLDEDVTKLTGVKWSQTKKTWYVPDNKF